MPRCRRVCRAPQTFSKTRYLAYSDALKNIDSTNSETLHEETPWGRDF